MNLRRFDLASTIEDTSYQYESFFEQNIEDPLTIYRNKKHTTFWTFNKNYFEMGAGWTYSNGHPLSADPSQIIFKIDPDNFTISYEASAKAMIIGKVLEIPTTTWYTDHTFNNNKFFHHYSTGDMILSDGSVTIKGSNENLYLSGSNTGISILNGNITSSSGNIHLSSGDITLNGANKGITVTSSGGYVCAPTLSATTTITNTIKIGDATNTEIGEIDFIGGTHTFGTYVGRMRFKIGNNYFSFPVYND
jgi:hypothetical protein